MKKMSMPFRKQLIEENFEELSNFYIKIIKSAKAAHTLFSDSEEEDSLKYETIQIMEICVNLLPYSDESLEESGILLKEMFLKKIQEVFIKSELIDQELNKIKLKEKVSKL